MVGRCALGVRTVSLRAQAMGSWAASPLDPTQQQSPRVPESQVSPMSKRARKRRSRKKNGANHGKKPNA